MVHKQFQKTLEETWTVSPADGIQGKNGMRAKKPTTVVPCSKTVEITPLESVVPGELRWLDPFTLYKSQSGEDQHIQENYFKDLCNGTYIELGALDGIMFSNTYMFRNALDWKGILIEASPSSFARLQQNRKDGEISLENMAVCTQQGTVHYIDEGPACCRGIYEFMKPEFVETWHRNLADNPPNATNGQELPPGVFKISCNTITSVLQKNKINHIDLFSLDVEGGEVQVLKSIDFAAVTFGLLVIESNNSTFQFKEILEPHGYKHIETNLRSDWFVNANFKDWYGHDPVPVEASA